LAFEVGDAVFEVAGRGAAERANDREDEVADADEDGDSGR